MHHLFTHLIGGNVHCRLSSPFKQRYLSYSLHNYLPFYVFSITITILLDEPNIIFYFHEIEFIVFCLLIMFCCHFQENIVKFNILKVFPYVFWEFCGFYLLYLVFWSRFCLFLKHSMRQQFRIRNYTSFVEVTNFSVNEWMVLILSWNSFDYI